MMSRRRFLAAPLAAAAAAPIDATANAGPGAGTPTLFEMRHYVTQPGRREDLIAMFEEHFLDAYERAGATILATCRNLDDPLRWWWIRAFADLESRKAALAGFYGGQVWQARSDACNATLDDVGDARLLVALDGDALKSPPPRPPRGAAAVPDSLIETRIADLEAGEVDAYIRWEAAELRPLLRELGAMPLASLASAPAVPPEAGRGLRDGRFVVTLCRFADRAAHEAHVRARLASPAWRTVEAAASRRARAPVEVLRLQPTARSALR